MRLNANWSKIFALVASLYIYISEGAAQTFRRITDIEEIEAGACYMIGGYCNKKDTVLLMAAQEGTGEDYGTRKAVAAPLRDNNRVEATDETAVFELEQNNSYYYFRDTALNAYLSYQNLMVDKYTPVYTLSDEEINEENSSKVSWYKSFTLNEDYPDESKTFVKTREKIKYQAGKSVEFAMLSDKKNGVFRLYRTESYGDSLFLYKKVETPELETTGAGDWTFYGDWTADSLYSFPFADAKRIDFTGITLPSKPTETGNISFPAEYVWTYVGYGEAEKLPDGWPNVIEVTDKGANVEGEAVTQIVGNDSCVLGAKYSFSVPADMEISWTRTVPDDGGWLSGAFPFDVRQATWGSSGGEQADVECMTYVRTIEQGVVFTEAEPDEAMTALQPFLWRPAESEGDIVCFSSSDVTVQTSSDSTETGAGFYGTCCRIGFAQAQDALYVLSDDGLSFVRPDAGSSLNACRAYLIYNGSSAADLRILSVQTGIENVKLTNSDAKLRPVYRPDGTIAGFLPADAEIPSDWPSGIYVTAKGKVSKK